MKYCIKIILFLLVILPSYAQATEERPKPIDTQSHREEEVKKDTPSQQTRNSKNSTAPIQKVNSENPKNNYPPNTDKKQYSNKIGWWSKFFNDPVAVFTAGLFVVTLLLLPLSETLDPPNFVNGSIGNLPPNQVFHAYPTLPAKLSETDLKAIETGVGGVFIWGYLEYVNIFKVKHNVSFRLLSTKTDFSRSEFIYCDEGNKEN